MELIVTGYVSGTFGVDGFIKVVSSSGEYNHFLDLEKVYIVFCKTKLNLQQCKNSWFDVEAVRVISSCVLLKLKGVDALEDAKLFVGGEVQVSRENASSLSANEFYAYDLCLCKVIFNKMTVGKAVNVVDGGAGILLEIKKCNGDVCYIPFNDKFIGVVNLEEKTIELKEEWILE